MQAQSPSTKTASTRAPGARSLQAGATPAEAYRALRYQRETLGDQLRSLEGRREELIQNLQSPTLVAASRPGLEKRVQDMDQRISELDKQVATAAAEVARASAVPGATIQPPRPPQQGPPDEFYALGGLFMVIVFLPLSIAFARRIWRKSARVTVQLPPELSDRIAGLERAVEAVAVEVERIGEGQRFVTQVMAQGPRAIGAGEAQPIPVRQREAVPEQRR